MRRLIAPVLFPLVLLTMIVGVSSQEVLRQPRPRYHIVRLSNLPDTVNSRGSAINNLGWVGGYTVPPSEMGNRRAAVWAWGFRFDLDTLGGPNSSVVWPGMNDIGTIVGIAQTGEAERYGEEWSCGAFFGANRFGNKCVGVVWEWGETRALPTLGGDNGFATGVNNHRQIVGWAENTVVDDTCANKQIYQFRAVQWGPRRHEMRELRPLGRDSSSAATAINDRGQVVGISGKCDVAVGRFSAEHAVIWENGRARNLGDLGIAMWNTPMALNQRGEIVGFAADPQVTNPDAPLLHAVYWPKHGRIQQLEELTTHTNSRAFAINERGQVAGMSCPASGSCHAVLWHDSPTPLNLNSVSDDPGVHLENAQDINDFGQITGRAIDTTTKALFAYVAVPIR